MLLKSFCHSQSNCAKGRPSDFFVVVCGRRPIVQTIVRLEKPDESCCFDFGEFRATAQHGDDGNAACKLYP